VDSTGVRLAVRDFGASGRAIILLYGLGRSLSDWQLIAPLLSLEHHIVAFDLRCHGHSDDGAWSWDNALADIAAVADHLQLTNWGMRLRQSGHRGRPAERSSSTLPSSAPPGFAFCVRSGTND